jgi:hypothetical protein
MVEHKRGLGAGLYMLLFALMVFGVFWYGSTH